MPAVELRKNIHWIGVNDHTTDLFEGLWPITQEGVSYNSYLINDQKKAIIDLAKSIKVDQFFKRIAEIIDPSQVDYIILNHMEPDHTGVLRVLRKIAPHATILCSSKAKDMIQAFYGMTDQVDCSRWRRSRIGWINSPIFYDSFCSLAGNHDDF